jgi:DNA-binding transcriptional LysR family regulator
MKRDFDWNLVRSFLAALDHGSLLAASRTLGTGQPTVGRHVAELEAQLGVVLFERTGRGLRPTAAAQELAADARAMQAAAHQLGRTAQGADSAGVGTVRVSASQPVACYLLPPLLAQLQAMHPAIQVELVSSNAVSNLLRREADIALRMVQPEQGTLIARRLGAVSVSAYAHRDYVRRRGAPREASDLPAHALVGEDRATNIVQGFAKFGVTLAKEAFVLRTDDMVAYWQAVRAALGIGFIADYVARTDPAVVPLLPSLRIPPLPIWLVVHRELRTSARIRTVYDFLAQAVPRAI